MKGARAALGLLLALAPAAAAGLQRPPGLADVTAVRHWSYGDYTRVVVETSSRVHTEVRRLPADPRAKRPERLYLDLSGVWIGRDYAKPIPIGDGLLRAVRLGQNTLRRTRVVIDLEHYDHHRLMHLSSPPRVVVDVYGPPPAPRRVEPRLSSELRPLRTVVVDAGHGGSDPGAIGVGGLTEKWVTLRLARALVPLLEAQGFRVVQTREGDETLSLEERTARAEGEGGDLFVSLHANAAPRGSVRGIETYYLDKSYERHALRVASMENGVPQVELDPLQRALAELRVSHTSLLSAALAKSVQKSIVSDVRKRYRSVEDLGVKRGPFYVLFLASMPSILVEAGFVTHRAEARRLGSDAYLELVAEAIAEGVSRYRDDRAPLVARGAP
jgi:N-acetylmuramoyl-L-alanine amidase